MSVISIQQEQPSWQQQLAAQILMPIVSDLWKQHMDREKNRKENAMRSEAARMIGELANMGQNNDNGLLNNASVPAGYNSDAWANSFHKTDTPLTQFDLGTADILPPSAQSVQQAQQARVPTPADWNRIINQLRGTKRFSHVSPETIDKLFAPEIQSAEAAYKQSLRDKAAQDYSNASDAFGQLAAVMPWVISGHIPESIGNMVDNQSQRNRPQPMMQDVGGTMQGITYDPVTGTFTTQNSWAKTLTPQQIVENTYRDNLFDYTKEKDARDFAESVKQTEIDNARKDRQLTLQEEQLRDTSEARKQQREDANISRYGAPFAGSDGKMYQMDQYGNVRPFMIGDEHMDVPKTSNVQWDERTKNEVEYRNAEIKRIDKEIDDLQKQYDMTFDEEEQKLIREKIKVKQVERDVNRRKIEEKFSSPKQASFKSLGGHMLGVGNNTRIVKGGEFNAKRGSHTHAGTDYAMQEGTPITIHGDMGTDFKVTRVELDPNNPSNYGCMVDIEGTRNGKKVRYRMAHMQEGSINVQVGDTVKLGDVIGNVGNTGRSSGSHLHLEVREWDGSTWQLKNPEKFIREGEVPQKKPVESSSASQTNAQDESSVSQEQMPYDNVNAYNPNPLPIPLTGAGYTASQTNAQISPAPSNWEKDVADVLQEARRGLPNYDLSNAEFSASLPGSGIASNGATRIDPDGGLTQYRAEGDNSSVTWRNSSGNPMRTSDGQLFTQQVYEDWARKADAGEYRDRKIYSRADLDKWLENVGMHRETPSEQRGLNNLNGNSNANVPLESEDTNVTPFNITPQTHPEQYPAPEFTDTLNGTTPRDTDELLNGLNGLVDKQYERWTNVLRRYYPETLSSMSGEQASNSSDFATPTQATINQPNLSTADTDLNSPISDDEIRQTVGGRAKHPPVQRRVRVRKVSKKAVPKKATPQQTAPAPKKVTPKAGRTNYEEQRTHVDNAAKTHGIDNELIRAVIQVESGWNPNARSKAGAMGLMQLMPATAKSLGVKDAYDPAQNIAGGSKYIAQLVKKYGGDVSKALMAYNCGPGNVNRGRVPKSSKAYAKKVMGIYNALKAQR